MKFLATQIVLSGLFLAATAHSNIHTQEIRKEGESGHQIHPKIGTSIKRTGDSNGGSFSWSSSSNGASGVHPAHHLVGHQEKTVTSNSESQTESWVQFLQKYAEKISSLASGKKWSELAQWLVSVSSSADFPVKSCSRSNGRVILIRLKGVTQQELQSVLQKNRDSKTGGDGWWILITRLGSKDANPETEKKVIDIVTQNQEDIRKNIRSGKWQLVIQLLTRKSEEQGLSVDWNKVLSDESPNGKSLQRILLTWAKTNPQDAQKLTVNQWLQPKVAPKDQPNTDRPEDETHGTIDVHTGIKGPKGPKDHPVTKPGDKTHGPKGPHDHHVTTRKPGDKTHANIDIHGNSKGPNGPKGSHDHHPTTGKPGDKTHGKIDIHSGVKGPNGPKGPKDHPVTKPGDKTHGSVDIHGVNKGPNGPKGPHDHHPTTGKPGDKTHGNIDIHTGIKGAKGPHDHHGTTEKPGHKTHGTIGINTGIKGPNGPKGSHDHHPTTGKPGDKTHGSIDIHGGVKGPKGPKPTPGHPGKQHPTPKHPEGTKGSIDIHSGVKGPKDHPVTTTKPGDKTHGKIDIHTGINGSKGPKDHSVTTKKPGDKTHGSVDIHTGIKGPNGSKPTPGHPGKQHPTPKHNGPNGVNGGIIKTGSHPTPKRPDGSTDGKVSIDVNGQTTGPHSPKGTKGPKGPKGPTKVTGETKPGHQKPHNRPIRRKAKSEEEKKKTMQVVVKETGTSEQQLEKAVQQNKQGTSGADGWFVLMIESSGGKNSPQTQEKVTRVIDQNESWIRQKVSSGDWDALILLLSQESQKQGLDVDWNKALKGKNSSFWRMILTKWASSGSQEAQDMDIETWITGDSDLGAKRAESLILILQQNQPQVRSLLQQGKTAELKQLLQQKAQDAGIDADWTHVNFSNPDSDSEDSQWLQIIRQTAQKPADEITADDFYQEVSQQFGQGQAFGSLGDLLNGFRSGFFSQLAKGSTGGLTQILGSVGLGGGSGAGTGILSSLGMGSGSSGLLSGLMGGKSGSSGSQNSYSWSSDGSSGGSSGSSSGGASGGSSGGLLSGLTGGLTGGRGLSFGLGR